MNNIINSFKCLQINCNTHTVTTMDLDKLPVSTYRVQTVDKKAIEKERKDWWNKFFTKVITITKQAFSFTLKWNVVNILTFSMRIQDRNAWKRKKFTRLINQSQWLADVRRSGDRILSKRSFQFFICRDLEGDIPSSKTFRRWVREHEDEIDERMYFSSQDDKY